VVSAASLIVTLSTRSQTIVDTTANSSAKPGLTPDPNMVAPPRRHASAIRSRSGPRLRPVMKDAVATTFTPADRMRTSSSGSTHIGLYTTQSGCSASSASTSFVAATPRGAMPHRSPTSRPTFSVDQA